MDRPQTLAFLNRFVETQGNLKILDFWDAEIGYDEALKYIQCYLSIGYKRQLEIMKEKYANDPEIMKILNKEVIL